jgi:hypothetical protein
MVKPDLKKYAQEINEMRMLPPASVEIPPVAALAIISHIQLASRHPGTESVEFTRIAIDVAKQLQNLFNPESTTYQVLELGWNPEEDLPVDELREKDPQLLEAIKNYFAREGIDLDSDSDCTEPCEDFTNNLGCKCTGYQVAELVAGGEQIPPQTLAAGAAIMHQIKQSLESEGFELDM